MSREIRRLAWRALREEGFDAFASRTAWRYTGGDVDVVNFQSFGSSIADAVGCTTFSFSVNLGVSLAEDEQPPSLAVRRDSQGRPRPQEYQCPHRRRLLKSLRQPWFEPFSADTRHWPLSLRRHRQGLEKVTRRDRHDRSHIWFVKPDGSNLDECLEDAVSALRAEGFPWLAATRRDRRAPPSQPTAEDEALLQALRRGR